MSEHVIIIVVVSIVCAALGGSYTWYIVTKAQTRQRELLSAERLAAIEKGLAPPSDSLYRAFRLGTRTRAPWLNPDVLSWVVAGGAVGASLAGTVLVSPAASQWAGFCVGASLGLAFSALQRTRSVWGGPLASLKSAASRCVDRLVQVI